MNRLSMLHQSLPTWLVLDEVDEILIVDWSSKRPITPSDLPHDHRIKIVRVVNQPWWIPSKCHNLGMRIVIGTVLLKVDSDYKISRNFFQKHDLDNSKFFCGNWEKYLGKEERHLYGGLYVYREKLLAINGYNERIKTYGWEDDDLYNRLNESGLTRCDLDYDTLYHIPHSNVSRLEHQPITCLNQSIDENHRLSDNNPWTTSDLLTSWKIIEANQYLETSQPPSGSSKDLKYPGSP